MEIEKKFTIKYLPKDLKRYEKWIIEQGYLCTNPVVRIRKCNNQFILTYKSKYGIEEEKQAAICNEIEVPLNEEGYYHLRKKVDNHLISKERYIIPIEGGLNVELDIFKGHLEGLVFAEVEFVSLEQAAAFKPPEWLHKEVSSDIRYANHYLSQIDKWD